MVVSVSTYTSPLVAGGGEAVWQCDADAEAHSVWAAHVLAGWTGLCVLAPLSGVPQRVQLVPIRDISYVRGAAQPIATQSAAKVPLPPLSGTVFESRSRIGHSLSAPMRSLTATLADHQSTAKRQQVSGWHGSARRWSSGSGGAAFSSTSRRDLGKEYKEAYFKAAQKLQRDQTTSPFKSPQVRGKRSRVTLARTNGGSGVRRTPSDSTGRGREQTSPSVSFAKRLLLDPVSPSAKAGTLDYAADTAGDGGQRQRSKAAREQELRGAIDSALQRWHALRDGGSQCLCGGLQDGDACLACREFDVGVQSCVKRIVSLCVELHGPEGAEDAAVDLGVWLRPKPYLAVEDKERKKALRRNCVLQMLLRLEWGAVAKDYVFLQRRRRLLKKKAGGGGGGGGGGKGGAATVETPTVQEQRRRRRDPLPRYIVSELVHYSQLLAMLVTDAQFFHRYLERHLVRAYAPTLPETLVDLYEVLEIKYPTLLERYLVDSENGGGGGGGDGGGGGGGAHIGASSLTGVRVSPSPGRAGGTSYASRIAVDATPQKGRVTIAVPRVRSTAKRMLQFSEYNNSAGLDITARSPPKKKAAAAVTSTAAVSQQQQQQQEEGRIGALGADRKLKRGAPGRRGGGGGLDTLFRTTSFKKRRR